MMEAVGDIWKWAEEHSADAVCVLTNMTVADGKLIMGGGQARQARTKFPTLPESWGQYYENRGNLGANVVATQFQEGNPYWLVSFPTKVHPSEDSTLELIETSAHTLVEITDFQGWKKVVLPRPGCGLGSLVWPDVRPVIEPILDDRFIVITNTVRS